MRSAPAASSSGCLVVFAAALLGPGGAAARLSAGRAMIDLRIEPQSRGYLARGVGTLEFVGASTSKAEQLLSGALEVLGQTGARQRALLMLACLQHARGDRVAGNVLPRTQGYAPHLGREIDRWKADRDGLVGDASLPACFADRRLVVAHAPMAQPRARVAPQDDSRDQTERSRAGMTYDTGDIQTILSIK